MHRPSDNALDKAGMGFRLPICDCQKKRDLLRSIYVGIVQKACWEGRQGQGRHHLSYILSLTRRWSVYP